MRRRILTRMLGIIELLAPHTQIVCLADLEQQIFDYLPGVGPQRIEEIKAALSPLLIDLGPENHRSPNSEIVAFGNDVLSGRHRGARYIGVSKLPYNPRTVDWAKTVRMALGILQRNIRAGSGDWGHHVAILVASAPRLRNCPPISTAGLNRLGISYSSMKRRQYLQRDLLLSWLNQNRPIVHLSTLAKPLSYLPT